MAAARPTIPEPLQRSGPAVIAFAIGVATAVYTLAAHAFPDFIVFWTAARHASDPLLYDSAHMTAAQAWMAGSGPRPFVYPPTFLLLAWPFGFLPALTAFALWAGLSGAVLTLAARQIVRPWWATLLLPVSLPVLMAIAYGQSTPFAVAALITAAAQVDRRPQLAGAMVAVAALIKPQLMILSPLLLLLGGWPSMRAAVLTGCALVAASLAFGPSRWLEWLEALPRFEVIVRHMSSPKFINPLDPALSLPMKALTVASGIAFALVCLRQGPAERVVGIVAGSLCCTLYAVRPDLVALAPSAVAWLAGGRTLDAWIRRGAGLALLGGLIGGPAGVLGFMAATAAAGAARGHGASALREPVADPA
jgi:hypothetical protein